MSILKNLNTRNKVLLIFVPVALLFALQVGMVYVFVQRMNDEIEEVESVRIESVLAINAFMQELSANQQRYQLLADQDNPEIPFEDLVYEVFAAEERLSSLLTRVSDMIGSRLPGTGPADPGSADAGAERTESQTLVAELVNAFQEYNATNRTVTETFELYNTIDAISTELLSVEQRAMRDSVARTREEGAALTRLLVIVAAAVVGLSLIIAFWFGTSLSRPIRGVALGLRQMANGEGDLTTRLTVRSDDEVGQVAASFNDFTEMLAGMIGKLKNSVDTLTTSGEALAANAEENAASINQINGNVQSVNALVARQNESVESSTTAMEEISRNVANLNAVIEEQSASVSESTASIEEMVANVKSASEMINRVREAMHSLEEAAVKGRELMNQVSHESKDVAGKSDLLLETNTILSNIAAQTNLLSMNAAIEAAHAGDAGAGFAVVAAEIRKLAQNSSQQSRSIAERLKQIKGSIDSIVTSSRDADAAFGRVQDLVQDTSRMQSEVTHAMEEQATGGQQVLEGLSQINDVTAQVKDGAREMQTGSDAVTQEMTTLRDLSQEVRQAMEEISGGTTEIENGVQELQTTSLENQQSIQELAKEAERFKT